MLHYEKWMLSVEVLVSGILGRAEVQICEVMTWEVGGITSGGGT